MAGQNCFLAVLLRCGVKRPDHPVALWCAMEGLALRLKAATEMARFPEPLTRGLDL